MALIDQIKVAYDFLETLPIVFERIELEDHVAEVTMRAMEKKNYPMTQRNIESALGQTLNQVIKVLEDYTFEKSYTYSFDYSYQGCGFKLDKDPILTS